MVARAIVTDVKVASEDLSYPVIVGSGVLGRVGQELRRAVPRARRVAVISDETVMPLYGPRVRDTLREAELEVVELAVPAGERSKTPDRLLELCGALLDAGLSRTDAVVALGGGVVGDLAGLVAALFMRGIGVLQCPTSLLAQVDASVGGKVAVDLPMGKNLLGTFHFPRAVLVDPDVLGTLPDEELACGLAEMVKHGALFDREHFERLQADADAIYRRSPKVLGPLVATSIALKAACVSRDPLEMAGAGKGRVVLNLGHTLGHAIESASEYRLRHGEAVALGLVAAGRLSLRRGLTQHDLETIIVQALQRLRLPTDLAPWLRPPNLARVEAALRHDKKRESQSTVTYIGLAAIGEPRVVSLPIAELIETLLG
jgi:3-dehydroquinate synthase